MIQCTNVAAVCQARANVLSGYQTLPPQIAVPIKTYASVSVTDGNKLSALQSKPSFS